MALNVVDLLEAVMEGKDITSDQLDKLKAEHLPEREHLEYKHGDILKTPSDARVMLRQYVSGFANSDGGLLLVGIDEPTMTVTGAVAPGGSDLAQWASDCIIPIASYFSPLPRFHVIDHKDGKVLVAATFRSALLVQVIEAGRPIYYFRFHDKTLAAPDFLVADLVLGRRSHPVLEITDTFFADIDNPIEDYHGRAIRYALFRLKFRIENSGFLAADDAHMGLIYFDSTPSDQHRLNRVLASYVNIAPLNEPRLIYDLFLKHTLIFAGAELTRPFSTALFETNINPRVKLPLSINNQWLTYNWKAAAYVVVRDGPPTWYQVTIKVDQHFPAAVASERQDPTHGQLSITKHNWLDVQRLGAERPAVTWENLALR